MTLTQDPPDRIRLTDPADVLAVVPYLLGFRPEESLVVLALEHGRVALTARFDLGAVEQTGPFSHHLRMVLRHVKRPDVVLLAYSSSRSSAETALQEAQRAATPWPVVAALLTDGETWSRPGQPASPFDPTTSAAAASAVLAGLPLLPSRGDLADLVAGPPESRRGELSALVEAATRSVEELSPADRLAAAATWLKGRLESPRPLDDADCLRGAALVRSPACHEMACLAIDRGNAESSMDLWLQVVRVTTGGLEVPALCLLAGAAWMTGNGALQGVCLERASLLEPRLPLLVFLQSVNLAALPPCDWAEALRRVSQAGARAVAYGP